MRLLVVVCVTAASALAPLAGCGTPSTAVPPVVTATIVNYGGAEAMRDVSAITATAVITAYDDEGTARVSAAEVVIRPNAGRIEAIARLPQGNWRAKVKLDGGASVRTSGSLELSSEQKREIGDTLRLILHRVRGPVNLLDGGERPGASGPAPLAGHRLIRVPSAGRAELVEAYYFDAGTDELRFVAVGPAEPGERGKVTVLTNKRTRGGLMLPVVMEVLRRGENSLLGERKYLQVRLTEVRVR